MVRTLHEHQDNINYITNYSQGEFPHIHHTQMQKNQIKWLQMKNYCACTNLSGVCTSVDTQQAAVLVTMMVGGGVVHPMMPTAEEENKISDN